MLRTFPFHGIAVANRSAIFRCVRPDIAADSFEEFVMACDNVGGVYTTLEAEVRNTIFRRVSEIGRSKKAQDEIRWLIKFGQSAAQISPKSKISRLARNRVE